jgi:two-component system, OmpR family, response regulator
MKVLLIEDDADTARFVAKGLRENNHAVDQAANGRDGLSLASGGTHDIMVIDRMLPGMDGLSIVKSIRAAGVRSPVLILTNLGGISDRVEGLEAGADDYLVKPFALAELLARINALARRPAMSPGDPVLKVADLELDRLNRSVKRGGKVIDLQPQEFKLLEYLMRHAEQVVTRAMLLENVWEYHFDPRTSVVETHISRLRAKVDRGFPVELIQTLRGAGYIVRASH